MEPRPGSPSIQLLERVLSELTEELKCPLCLGYFNTPVILNCFHTFCATCLEEIGNNFL